MMVVVAVIVAVIRATVIVFRRMPGMLSGFVIGLSRHVIFPSAAQDLFGCR